MQVYKNHLANQNIVSSHRRNDAQVNGRCILVGMTRKWSGNLSNTTHSLWIRRYDANCPHVMQNIFCSNRFSPYSWFSKSYILWNVLVKVMTYHLYTCNNILRRARHDWCGFEWHYLIIFFYQHVKVLIYGIWSIRTCWVCWWRQNIFHTTDFDDIWSMAPSCTFTGRRVRGGSHMKTNK